MEQVTTLNGYDLFEVVSAFQKEIRRCNEEGAMYWGVELYESGFIPYACETDVYQLNGGYRAG
jgi:replication-associated recombination protein RarA